MKNHNYENEGQFQRKMTSRHLFMLSLGGVIGTGLFLSSGYTIAQAGPLGAILSYLVGAVVVYLVMLSLGELAVAMPVTGSFHTYATKFISPGTGFTVAWLYWICWTVALGTEFLGAAMLMQRWFPSVPAWIFAAFFALVILGINALSVRSFAEAESVFSSIKVSAILVFIILGLGAMFCLLYTSSNGKGTGFGQEQWRHYATSFAKGQKNMEVTYYDSPHYFYHYQTKEMIRSIEEFVQETTD